VITGQQTGLYLGPLFTLYKACSAIAAARRLENEIGRPVVPIFWIQDEDHDFLEVNHTYLPNPGDVPVRLAVESVLTATDNDRVPVRYQVLPESVLKANSILLEQIQSGMENADLVAAISASYRPGESISEAFKKLLSAVFAEEGLIIFDPRDAEVAGLLSKVYHRALTESADLSALLEQRSAAIEGLGLAVQVTPRKASPLFFVHPDGIDSARYRIERAGSEWKFIGRSGTVSDETLRNWIETEPLRLSSSAVFRPILQDTLFPTLAYIGGPGEINYWAQLRPLYNHFELTMPLVLPRASFLLIEEKVAKLTTQLNLSLSDLLLSAEEIERKIASSLSAHPPAKELFQRTQSALERNLNELFEVLTSVDKTLLNAFAKSRDKFFEQLKGLESRYEAAVLRADSVSSDRLARLRQLISPEGIPQERFYSALYFVARYGESLKKRLIANSDDSGSIKELTV